MIQKDFDKITRADIDSLIENAVRESKTIEYKEQLPDRSEKQRKEFLADVSSFANASGGDLIYGIKEKRDENGKKTGLPECIKQIQGYTADEAKLRMEQMIRDGISPRFPFRMREIEGFGEDNTGFIILIHIPKSFASPHMVSLNHAQKFFSRTSAGKYRLEVGEIRSAFLATDSQAERLKRFRQDRLAQIVSDETPVPLPSPRRLVLHVIPIESFLNNARLDVAANKVATKDMRPIGASGWSDRFNLEGLLSFSSHERFSNASFSYCQLFFDGTIEAVWSQMGGYGENDTIDLKSIAGKLLRSVESYIAVQKSLGIQPPVSASSTLLGYKSCQLRDTNYGMSFPIDRDSLVLPSVMIKSFDVSVEQMIRPMLDALWNVGGVARCPYCDTDGNWNAG